jgi:hypothetical protein
MKKVLRDKKIIELSKTTPLSDISEKYNVSYERVRQIVRVRKPRNDYEKIKTTYQNNIAKILKNNFEQEIERLKIKNRNKEIVIQKVILVKYLVDHYEYTISQVARLLNMHHTTIVHLYNKV